MAPNNANTMACAALAAESLGFDGVTAALIVDPSLHSHVVEVHVRGPSSVLSSQSGISLPTSSSAEQSRDGDEGAEEEQVFRVDTIRHNPAQKGAVTGNATYASFLASMLLASGKGPGVHLC